jgi:hypothetical protein
VASRDRRSEGLRRKLIAFDRENWQAVHQLSLDSLKSVQELADEAFADLLKKHRRPVTLKDALRESVRLLPANDPAMRRKASKTPRKR